MVNTAPKPGVPQFSAANGFDISGDREVGALGLSLVADADGDARVEFYLGNRERFSGGLGLLNVVPNPARARWRDSFLFFPGPDYRWWHFDPNGDGNADIFTARTIDPGDPGTGQFAKGRGVDVDFYFENTGNGARQAASNVLPKPAGDPDAFTLGESVTISQIGQTFADNGVRAADIDGDGRQELLVLGERLRCQINFDGKCDNLAGTPPLTPRKPFLIKLGYDGAWKTEDLKGTLAPDAGYAPSLTGGLEYSRAITSLRVRPGLPTALVNFGYKLTRILDVDGDGIPEILRPRLRGNPTTSLDHVLEVFRREPTKLDLLSAVTDSVGATTSLVYAPMSDRSVYTPFKQADCKYPLACPTRGRWLVKEVKRPTGLASPAQRSELHTYARAAVDLNGRDWLGMQEHTVTLPDRQSQTVVGIDNVTMVGPPSGSPHFFPFAGLVSTETTTFTAGDFGPNVISDSVERITNLQNLSMQPDRVLIRPRQPCEFRFDTTQPPGGQPTINVYSQVCTVHENYDAFGFPRTVSRIGGFEKRVTETIYEHRDAQSPRLLGIVTKVTETSTAQSRPTQPETRTTTYDPDGNGLPKSEVLEAKSTLLPALPAISVTTTYVRDDVGQPLSVSVISDAAAPVPGTTTWTPDPRVRTTRYEYDFFGNKTRVVNPLGHEERFAYDSALGGLLAHVDANQVLTQYGYDGFGRPLLVSSPVEGDTSYRYFIDGQHPEAPQALLTRRLGKDGTFLGSATVHEDALLRPVLEETAAPRGRTVAVRTRYDLLGRVAGVSAPQFTSVTTPPVFGTREYDNQDRLRKRIEPDQIVSLRGHYERLTSTMTDALGHQHVVVRDPYGVPLQSQSRDEIGRLKGQVILTYGPFGVTDKLTKQLNGVSVDTAMRYDGLGRRIEEADPDRGTTSYASNGFGELVHQKDAIGLQTRTYDLLGRTATITDPDGVTSFTYDSAAGGLGKLASATSPDGIVQERQYDVLGRPTVEATRVPSLAAAGVAGTLELEHLYDAAGRAGGLRYPRATSSKRFEIAFEYSASAGAVLMGVKDAGGKSLWRAEDFSPYGDLAQELYGNKLRVTRAIGPLTGLLNGTTGGFVTGAAYPESSPEPVPGIGAAPAVQAVDYEYDDDRNLFQRSDSSRAVGGVDVDVSVNEIYGYDALHRLSSWSVTVGDGTTTYSYPFDDFGNLKGRTTPAGINEWKFDYGSARPHAVTSATVNGVTKTFDYDGRGRRSRDGDRTVAYRFFDLPRTLTQGSTTLASFEYDAFQGRIRKRSATREIVTLGDLYERQAAPTALAAPTHVFRVLGPGRTVAEIEWDALGKQTDERYLQPDRLGSVELVTGAATPNQVLGRNRFEPYGNSVDPANPLADAPQILSGGTRHGFTGHEHDEDLGLVNMGGRLYDPRSGAFLSPDPQVSKVGWAHAFHPYSYVANNPVNAIDPTGFGIVSLTYDPSAAAGSPGSWESIVEAGVAMTADGGVLICHVVGEDGTRACVVVVKQVGCKTSGKSSGRLNITAGTVMNLPDLGELYKQYKGYGGGARGLLLMLDDNFNPASRSIRKYKEGVKEWNEGKKGKAVVSAIESGLAAAEVVGMVRGALEGEASASGGRNAGSAKSGSIKEPPPPRGEEGRDASGRKTVDFSESDALYQPKPGEKNIVTIEYTGSRRKDFAAANAAAGLEETPDLHTWHHLHDYSPETNTGTMQCVLTCSHQATSHVGGVNQYEAARGVEYKR